MQPNEQINFQYCSGCNFLPTSGEIFHRPFCLQSSNAFYVLTCSYGLFYLNDFIILVRRNVANFSNVIEHNHGIEKMKSKL